MAHCTLASSRELGRRGRASTMRQNARRHRVAAREGSWLITASAAVGIEGREGTWRHVEARGGNAAREASKSAGGPSTVDRAARASVFYAESSNSKTIKLRARHSKESSTRRPRRLPFHGACVRCV